MGKKADAEVGREGKEGARTNEAVLVTAGRTLNSSMGTKPGGVGVVSGHMLFFSHQIRKPELSDKGPESGPATVEVSSSNTMLSVTLCAALAWTPMHGMGLHDVSTVRAPQTAMMAAKGFGKPVPQKASVPKKASAGAQKRDKAGAAFDELKASGAPEYMVLVRTVPEGGEASNWYPVGGIAVPRSSSEDMALSLAIFNNEDDLLKGAFRSYPFLKKSTDKFEYGYRLKEFEDDPVKLATKEKSEEASNPITQW